MVHEPMCASASFTLHAVPAQEHACGRATSLVTQQRGKICKSYFSAIQASHSSWSGEVNTSSAVAQIKTDFQIRNMSFDKAAFLSGCWNLCRVFFAD